METPEENTLRLRLSGELDQHQASHIISEIQEKIHCTLPQLLVLDLEELSFADSSGIALLLRISRSMKQIQGKMEIINIQPQPLRLFQTAGLSALLQA